MPYKTAFLRPDRVSLQLIREQAARVAVEPLLIRMLDTAPNMVALLNPQRQIVYCNEACARAGGLRDREQALGLRPGELLDCIHVKEAPNGCGTGEACRACGFAQVLAEGYRGRAVKGECLIECESRQRETAHEFEVDVRPLEDGGRGWLCCSIQDISDRKRRDALEQIFFHDIMNHAGAVQGAVSCLAEEETTDDDRRLLTDLLSSSAQALVEEINSQRMLLAAERAELSVQKAPVNSLDQLRMAAATSTGFGCAEGKCVVVGTGAESLRFSTDTALLSRILLNLLKNALEASKRGGTVTATCLAVDDKIRFSVHNDTVIPESAQPHIFQRSFSTKGLGRGLGTYSVKLLAGKYLGGHVWFESAEGQGTTFHVDLPRN